MKFNRFTLSQLAVATVLILLGMGSAVTAQAGELKLEVQLIWGTNDKTSPDPKHRAVDAKVEEKLKKLPFKWQHYYQVCSHKFTATTGETHVEKLSKECEIKVRYLDKDTVEVELYGKGERVSKISQSLPKNEFIVTGGNAANLTAWFVVIRQAD